MHHITANFVSTPTRQKFEGREHLVVPVVMAIAGVEMNGATISAEELVPESWNGVPVTVTHPEYSGVQVSANQPIVLEDFAVGRIFNADVTDGKLRAEAWIDVARAQKHFPGLVEDLEKNSRQMDVSTGYFCKDVPDANGLLKHTDLKPDHLALLPNEQGACSWADGCGVRANRNGGSPMDAKAKRGLLVSIANALGIKLAGNALEDNAPGGKPCVCDGKTNARSDDKETMIADMISDDGTPFTGKDKAALEAMSDEALKALRDQFMPEGNAEEEDDDPPPAEGDEDDDPPPAEGDEEEPATNAGKKNGKGGKTVKGNAKPAELSADDKAALEFARNAFNKHRTELVQTITTNTDMTAEELAGVSTAVLEKMAANAQPAASYNGRGAPVVDVKDEDVITNMRAPSLDDAIKARRGDKNAA